ncbi:leukotriene B4 receptor 1-like [Python bivittatus]|uniref:Leukotriene B4 receptor 1-like n=1 Tax=Python bivittatus TaxID=176946 RepID=A0A9F2N9H2_PYTBI|nr:leukotriene B4 receptor 1-like [Python bivittatus]
MALLHATEIPANLTGTKARWVETSLIPSMFLTICFLIGVPGNGLVVWTILSTFPQRSFTIALILNLAVADLMVMLTVPFWIYYFVKDWVFGDFMCRFLIYLVYLTVYASIFSITLLSLHRFAVVVLPFASQRWRKPRGTHVVLLAVWLLAGVFSCPSLIFSSSQMTKGQCSDEFYEFDGQRLAVNIVETLFAFVIPFAVLAVCYTYVMRKIRTLKNHKKMKTGKLIAAVVGAFFVCWLPYHVLNLIIISALLLKYAKPEVTQALLDSIKTLTNLHGAVAFLSSCINPILYAFAARSFRGGLRETNFAKLFEKVHNDTEEKSAKDNTVSMQTL